MNLQKVDEIIENYGVDRSSTLAILQDVQAEYRYLPRQALERTAERLGVPLGEVHRMATFFRAFSLEPRGEHNIKVCLGTACHVRGGVQVLEKLERDLHIKAGETTPDGKFSLEVVRCLGACALGPLVVVDEGHHSEMTSAKVEKLLTPLLGGDMSKGRHDPGEASSAAGKRDKRTVASRALMRT
ncbi:MAG: NAD(P)H-dependent oxidoreductase subunit E [Anaerolineae bacterium]|nr:MAG: NAD(P)H-dependent oxidoreductase subunit E [Anaerolineae bacterium]